MHQLGLGRAHGGGARLGQAIKGDVPLARHVVHLPRRLGVAQDLDKGGGQVLDVAQLGHLPGARGRWYGQEGSNGFMYNSKKLNSLIQ